MYQKVYNSIIFISTTYRLIIKFFFSTFIFYLFDYSFIYLFFIIITNRLFPSLKFTIHFNFKTPLSISFFKHVQEMYIT